MTISRVLVIGAGGALGLEIVRLLAARGLDIVATYRTERPDVAKELKALGVELVQVDLSASDNIKQLINECDAAIFTPILSVSASAAKWLAKEQRAVFFSSNNVAIDPTASVYANLLEAEGVVQNSDGAVTILRPTMIYGYPGDGNLSRLMSAMTKWPLVPMPGTGNAMQQPVYYRDLAAVTVQRLLNPADAEVCCSVAGPAAATQKEVYRLAAKATGKNPFTPSIPLLPLSAALSLLEAIGIKPPVSKAQIARVEKDKVPQGAGVILTETTLDDGLRLLAAEMGLLTEEGAAPS